MRVAALHEDVLVVTSRVWRTTCTVVRAESEAFVVDSPVYPDELDVLPSLLEQSGFAAPGFAGGTGALLATHADWDHLLGRLAFPQAALGVAETTAARLRGEPGDAARRLREFDDEHYVARGRPLALGQVDPLPVPGRLQLGDRELELHPADGHTADGMAIVVPWARVLVCGDYLSPVELPMLSEGGSRDAYLATLRRLRPLVEAADHVVPGHGDVLDAQRALAILREDVAYLEALPAARLPPARRGGAQRRIHKANVARVG